MKYKKLDGRITKTVLDVLEALCADYPRRKRIIECRCRTRTSDAAVEDFRKTNQIIDCAMETVDMGLREYILIDIGSGNGYERSMASPFISKDSYYLQKNRAIEAMARGFNMII